MKVIKILGTGCANCVKLESNTKLALQKIGMEAEVQKVTDIAEITSYGVMKTPGLVIDDEVVSSGRVNEVDEIIDFLEATPCTEVGDGCCEDGVCCKDNECCKDRACCDKGDEASCCQDKKDMDTCCSPNEEKTSCCGHTKLSFCSKIKSFLSGIFKKK